MRVKLYARKTIAMNEIGFGFPRDVTITVDAFDGKKITHGSITDATGTTTPISPRGINIHESLAPLIPTGDGPKDIRAKISGTDDMDLLVYAIHDGERFQHTSIPPLTEEQIRSIRKGILGEGADPGAIRTESGLYYERYLPKLPDPAEQKPDLLGWFLKATSMIRGIAQKKPAHPDQTQKPLTPNFAQMAYGVTTVEDARDAVEAIAQVPAPPMTDVSHTARFTALEKLANSGAAAEVATLYFNDVQTATGKAQSSLLEVLRMDRLHDLDFRLQTLATFATLHPETAKDLHQKVQAFRKDVSDPEAIAQLQRTEAFLADLTHDSGP